MHHQHRFTGIAASSLDVLHDARFASTHPYSAGSVALLAAFGIGALSLRLAEPTDSIMHVMLWHYLPMLSVAILGLWLGKLVLKW